MAIGKSAVVDPAERLGQLMKQHGRAVTGLISFRERDVLTVEELVADVFVLAYDRLEELVELTDWQVRSWLLRTARHLVANEARRASSRRRNLEVLRREPLPLSAGADDEFFKLDQSAEEQRRSERIQLALEALSENDRGVLIWDAQGDKGPAIAARLGIGQAAARKRLSRARAAFMVAFEEPVESPVQDGSGQ